jgi:hypothetical protein
MLHRNLSQEALKSAPLVGRPGAPPLVVVDDHDAISGPSQGDCVIDEGVLPFPRVTVVEHLLGIGLSHVNDSKAVEMEIQDLGGSQDPGLPHRIFDGGPGGRDPIGLAAGIMSAHCRPPCRREALGAAARRRG